MSTWNIEDRKELGLRAAALLGREKPIPGTLWVWPDGTPFRWTEAGRGYDARGRCYEYVARGSWLDLGDAPTRGAILEEVRRAAKGGLFSQREGNMRYFARTYARRMALTPGTTVRSPQEFLALPPRHLAETLVDLLVHLRNLDEVAKLTLPPTKPSPCLDPDAMHGACDGFGGSDYDSHLVGRKP